MLNVIRPTKTNKKQTNKKPQNKNEKQTQKADCKLSKINNKKEKKKETTSLEILVFFRGREDTSFCKGNTIEPIVSLSTRIPRNPFVFFPLEFVNTGSYPEHFFH